MNAIKRAVAEDLEKMNLVSNDTLLIHSSYKSLGNLAITATELLQLFIDYFSKGTLLFPALSYKNVTPQTPYFDPRETPSCIGYLPEVFRTKFDVVRSYHPTHSVCALGKDATAMTSSHGKDRTPCGKHSPFTLLPEYNGKIMMLGCGLKPNTFMHSVEEIVVPDYLFGNMVTYSINDDKGFLYEKEYQTHGFDGFVQRYDRVSGLADSTWFNEGNIIGAKGYVMDAKKLRALSLEKIKANPHYFVDKIENNG